MVPMPYFPAISSGGMLVLRPEGPEMIARAPRRAQWESAWSVLPRR